MEACTAAAADCDVFLAVGTSLQVWPAAGLADIAVGTGARLVVVNAQPTPYDELADLVVRRADRYRAAAARRATLTGRCNASSAAAAAVSVTGTTDHVTGPREPACACL